MTIISLSITCLSTVNKNRISYLHVKIVIVFRTSYFSCDFNSISNMIRHIISSVLMI